VGKTTLGYAAHPIVADVRDMLKNLARGLIDPYQPELHYMRGPGPKWHRAPLDTYDAMMALMHFRSDAT